MNAAKLILPALIWAFVGQPGQAQEPSSDTYYVMIFGAQRPVLKDPRHSHSFATFVRLGADGAAEYFTISWLSLDGRVRPFELHAEPGRNWTLEETLQLCRENRMEVCNFGPYQIQPDLWRRAVEQKQWLESGNVRYKPMDEGSRDGTVSNCIHAISYMAREPGQQVPYVFVMPANWGESGSYWIALTLRPWFCDPCNPRYDIMQRVGLNPDCFKHWTLDRSPNPNPITRAVQAGFHRRLLPNRVFCD